MLVLALPSAAIAQAPEASLSWVRGPGAEACASAPEMAARIEAMVGRSVWTSLTSAKRFFEVWIAGIGGGKGLVATVSLEDREGHALGRRELRSAGARCEAIEAEAALVLALAFSSDPDPDLEPAWEEATTDEVPPPRPPPPPPPLPPRPFIEDDERPPPYPRERPRTKRGAVVHLVGALDGGRPGGWGMGIAASLLDLPPGIPLAFDVTFGLPRADTIPGTSRKLSVWHVDAGAAVCPLRFQRSSTWVWFCGGILAGVTRASGRGFVQPEARLVADVEPNASLRFALARPGSVGVAFVARLGFPLIQTRFAYVDENGIERTGFAAPAVRAFVGLGFQFGGGIKKAPGGEQ